MPVEVDEMDELIREASGRQLEILIIWKQCGQQAAFWQKGFGDTYKGKYNKMWSQSFWKKARSLAPEYFADENGILRCPLCQRELHDKFVLHHDFYPKKPSNLFNPLYFKLICRGCNYKEHKDKYEKEGK